MSTPIEIDKEMIQLKDDIELWNQRVAWFEAKRDWRKTRLALAEAKAQMDWAGAVGKAKAYGITQTERQRIDLDIASAELSMCEKTMDTLSKASFLLLARNKNAMQAYNMKEW